MTVRLLREALPAYQTKFSTPSMVVSEINNRDLFELFFAAGKEEIEEHTEKRHG